MNNNQPLILGDTEVLRFGDMGLDVEAIESAFLAKANGHLVAPPRHAVSFPGRGNLIFTIGGIIGDGAKLGFRVNNDFAAPGDVDDQFVAVWDSASARLEGLLLSRHLATIRTGAIGGVAIKYMSSPQAEIAAVIGSGRQAATQLEAATRVRGLREVRVFSRDEDRRRAFAHTMTERTGIACIAASSAEAAVNGAGIVILATTSRSPVIRADWLAKGTHINTLGPRFKSGHETGIDVAERAGLIATDSPAQIAAFAEPYFIADTPAMPRMRDLAEIVANGAQEPDPERDLSLFCSVGLAGTEVLVGAAIIAAARQGPAS